METAEKNILIGVFMGAKVSPYPGEREFEMYGIIECIEDGEDEQHFFTGSDMEFHESWDWIMPVVQKINIMDDYRYTVIIKSMDVEIYDNITNKIVFESEMKWQADELIHSLNEAVIGFINWYNKLN